MTAENDDCECWIDNDPLEGFIDERGCPIHDDQDADPEETP